MSELFDVWAFIDTPDGEVHDKVGENLTGEEAIAKFRSYINPRRPGNMLGIINQVMITDKLDCCTAHWRKGEGIIFPKEEKKDA